MSLCILISSGSNVMAAKTSDEIVVTGVAMSKESFKTNFGVSPDHRPYSRSAFEASDMNITDIVINGEDVGLNMELIGNDGTIILPLNGKLKAGYKTQNDINSAIIEVTGTTNGYEILLFEIFNDTEENNLLVNGDLEGMSHIKVYIKDEEDKIYLFEAPMPDAFKNIVAENYSKASKEKDALWASSLVDHVTRDLETDSEFLTKHGLNNQTRGLSEWTIWTNETTYYDSFYIGSDYVQCWSLPYVEYRHANVKSQDTSWIASFKVAEHMSIGGYTYYGNNVFEYRNLKISFGCGDKTTFIASEQEGNVYKYTGLLTGLKKATDSIAVHLLNKAVSSLPYGSTFMTVINAINTMSSSEGNVTLGSSGHTIANRKTVAVGEYLSDYLLEECTDHSGGENNGHYFTFRGILQYEAGSGNTNTVGALTVSFDKYYTGDSSYTTVSKQFQLDYSSQQ